MYGGVELDLREARFESAETTVHANCLFGGITIIVPDDIVVQVSGLPLFAGYGETENEAVDTPPATDPATYSPTTTRIRPPRPAR
jgi:hypothetical protein